MTLALLHQREVYLLVLGREDLPFYEAAARRLGVAERVRFCGFVSEIARFYAAADVVVARAGALTVSELAATGTPSVLVPLQGPGAHQRANAEFLVEAGAGELLDQHDLAMLPEVIMKILTPSELRRRAAAAAALGRPGAAAEVARQLIEVARG